VQHTDMIYSKASSIPRTLRNGITDAVRAWSRQASNRTFPISGIAFIRRWEHICCPGWRPIRKWLTACMLVASGGLVACSAPTEVIDLSVMPQATLDAMVHVPILPLGSPGPSGVTSVGPILGFGCGQTASGAASAAIRQLQIKTLNMQAAAVMDVLVTPAGSGPCHWSYGALASGTALTTRGPPGLW
jgi:hypothetical protein